MQYNGWKFIESEIQFTGGALGKGVSSLRTFKSKNDTVIVVANVNMLADDTNLYVPRYTVKTNILGTTTIANNFDSCNETLAKLMKHDVDKMFVQLKVYIFNYFLLTKENLKKTLNFIHRHCQPKMKKMKLL